MNILITGGVGYIGSHAAVHFARHGHHVTIVDNFSTSCESYLKKINDLCPNQLDFIFGDIRDRLFLDHLLESSSIEAVIHFAGFKSVSESVKIPLDYYDNNVIGTLALLHSMNKANIYNFIFSSSATIYGHQAVLPIKENTQCSRVESPYGRSKLIIEEVLRDLYAANAQWKIGILRYFNPVGAHKSGCIGEVSVGTPNNLIPYICDVATGKLPFLKVYGNDYNTHDGTGIRDYIHVEDLVNGHFLAFNKIVFNSSFNIWNLGSGVGYTVLEVVKAFERVNRIKIPYQIFARREGDIESSFADISKAQSQLGWSPVNGLDEMMFDAWNWHKNFS